MAFLVLFLAVFSRIAPALLHVTGANVTMQGAGLLFFGTHLKSGRQLLVLPALVLLAVTDYWLTVYAYGYPFHLAGYLPTWLWYGAVCLGASAFLQRRGVVRVGVAALTSATGFFLLSNGMVWLRGTLYPHTATGLRQCYVAGLPFYRNDLVSTLTFAAVFFSLPALGAALRSAAESVRNHGAGTI